LEDDAVKPPTKKQLLASILALDPAADARKLGRRKVADLARELKRLQRLPVALPVAVLAPPVAMLAPVIDTRPRALAVLWVLLASTVGAAFKRQR
jgi:hypothetical protein